MSQRILCCVLCAKVNTKQDIHTQTRRASLQQAGQDYNILHTLTLFLSSQSIIKKGLVTALHITLFTHQQRLAQRELKETLA